LNGRGIKKILGGWERNLENRGGMRSYGAAGCKRGAKGDLKKDRHEEESGKFFGVQERAMEGKSVN